MTKTIRRPAARRRATASTEPGIGRWASQITPSRSQITTAGSTSRQRTGPVLRPACQPGRVPRFEPFPALRYSPAVDLAAVVAPPYDVLSDDDVSELAARDEHNIVHVDVPRDPDRYAAAARLLRHWIAEGILVADEAPTFTLYRMRFADASGRRRDLVGAVGALEVVDDGSGGVLPHERTTPKASTDRLDLTRATESKHVARCGASRWRAGSPSCWPSRASSSARSRSTAVEHVVERVADRDRIAAISAKVADDEVLIADGHHRYGVSRIYRDEVRAETGREDTPAESTLAFVGELAADQLSIEAIHRLYTGVDAADLREALARSFDARTGRAARPGHARLDGRAGQPGARRSRRFG